MVSVIESGMCEGFRQELWCPRNYPNQGNPGPNITYYDFTWITPQIIINKHCKQILISKSILIHVGNSMMGTIADKNQVWFFFFCMATFRISGWFSRLHLGSWHPLIFYRCGEVNVTYFPWLRHATFLHPLRWFAPPQWPFPKADRVTPWLYLPPLQLLWMKLQKHQCSENPQCLPISSSGSGQFWL